MESKLRRERTGLDAMDVDTAVALVLEGPVNPHLSNTEYLEDHGSEAPSRCTFGSWYHAAPCDPLKDVKVIKTSSGSVRSVTLKAFNLFY